MELKTLGKYVDFCHKKGIKKIKIGEIEMEIGDKPMSDYKRRKLEKDNGVSPALPKAQYSEEEMLFWSAQGIPEEGVSGG